MQSWVGRIVILVLLAIIVGLPVAWRPPREQIDPDALKLVIVTPHNEQIRYETAHAFNDWHTERFGQAVRIDWRTPGGTSDIRRILISQYAAELERSIEIGEPLGDIGFDLAFGGGDYEFDKYYRRVGVTAEGVNPDGQIVSRTVALTQPIRLDHEAIDLEQVYGESGRIAGSKLYDQSALDQAEPDENPPVHWYGVVLSSFGIVYNRDVLELLDLPEPGDWDDLTDGKYFGWVALGDPRHSGSVRVTYNTIVQRYGYDKGWRTLRRVFANARYFSSGSSQVPVDVSAGDAAAGMCIDFYGRLQAEAVGGNRVGYLSPRGTTIYSCDPIAVLNGVRDTQHDPRRTLAKRFVQFQLTREGQAVWCLPPSDAMSDPPDDGLGPLKFALRRPPVRRDMYEPEMFSRMIDHVNYYEDAVPMPQGTPNYMGVINVVLSAMAMDIHDDLKAAWGAILREDDPQRRAEMIAVFDRMPVDSPEALFAVAAGWDDEAAEEHDRLVWTAFFRANYREVIGMAKQ